MAPVAKTKGSDDGATGKATAPGQEAVTRYAYDGAGRVEQVTNPLEQTWGMAMAGGAHLHFEIWQHDASLFAPGSSADDWWTLLRPAGQRPETDPHNLNPCSVIGGVLGCTGPNGLQEP